MKKLLAIFLLAGITITGPLEKGIAFYLLGEKHKAAIEWSKFFKKRKDVIAQGFKALAKGEYLSASYYFNAYRKRTRRAYYGKEEWLKYLGLSLALKDIAPYHRDWYVARAKILNPDNPIVEFTAGVYDLEMGRLKKARRRLERSVKKLKEWVFKIFMAKLLIEEGNLEKAVEEALPFLKKHHGIGYELIDALKDAGDYSQAWEVARKLPDKEETLPVKISLALKLKKLTEAENYIYRLPEGNPQREKFRAYLLYEKGKKRKARKILEKLSEILTFDGELWALLYKLEKKDEKRRMYAYLAFFNGADFKNIYGVKRYKLKKITKAKWANENKIVLLGSPKRGMEFGPYVFDLQQEKYIRIPLRLEIQDFFTSQKGNEILIVALDRARGKRIFYFFDLNSQKLQKVATLALTEDEYKAWFNSDYVIMYSKEYEYLPFQSPFKRMIAPGRYVSFYSKQINHLFVIYNRKIKRLKVYRNLKKLPVLSPDLKKYSILLKAYNTIPAVKSLINSYSSAVQGDLEVEFDRAGKTALFKRRVGIGHVPVGYVRNNRWIPLQLREDDKLLFLFKWMPELSAYLLYRDKKDKYLSFIFIEGYEKPEEIRENSTKAVAYKGQIYFLSFKRKTGGKGRLYLFDPQEKDSKKLTDYLWIDIFKINGLLLLKDFRTVVYRFYQRQAVPIFVASDYDVNFSPTNKKVLLTHPKKKLMFIAKVY